MPKFKLLPLLALLLLNSSVVTAGYVYRIYSPGATASVAGSSHSACTGPWGANLSHGASVTAYLEGSVDFGQSCVSESRTCQNGTVSGSYLFQTCSVQTAADCNLQGYVVNHDNSVFAYSASAVAAGSSCDSVKESRTCTNGTLSGSFAFTTCEVTPACPTTATVFAYTGTTQSISVPAGCTTATIKAWGAGGGSGYLGFGGGGGFASKVTSVTPGTQLAVEVGKGGTTYNVTTGATHGYGGSGGGLSGVFAGSVSQANAIVVAGGGGGGGSQPHGISVPVPPPAAAGCTSTAGGGTAPYFGGSSYAIGFNASAVAAGAGNGSAGRAGSSGNGLLGGSAYASLNQWGGAGGGGDGYFGGGGGGIMYTSGTNYVSGGPGGSGSCYAPGGTVVAGSGAFVANSTDSDYASGVGNSTDVYQETAQHGRVVIRWN